MEGRRERMGFFLVAEGVTGERGNEFAACLLYISDLGRQTE